MHKHGSPATGGEYATILLSDPIRHGGEQRTKDAAFALLWRSGVSKDTLQIVAPYHL